MAEGERGRWCPVPGVGTGLAPGRGGGEWRRAAWRGGAVRCVVVSGLAPWARCWGRKDSVAGVPGTGGGAGSGWWGVGEGSVARGCGGHPAWGPGQGWWGVAAWAAHLGCGAARGCGGRPARPPRRGGAGRGWIGPGVGSFGRVMAGAAVACRRYRLGSSERVERSPVRGLRPVQGARRRGVSAVRAERSTHPRSGAVTLPGVRAPQRSSPVRPRPQRRVTTSGHRGAASRRPRPANHDTATCRP